MRFELFIYNRADRVLEEKSLYRQIKSILGKIKIIDHQKIQDELKNYGWTLERRIAPFADWAWDAYINKVAVSIEFSSIDAIHRDLLRAILAHRYHDLDVLVFVTSVSKEPKFHNVRRDIDIFSKLLGFQILLIGLI